MKEYTLTIKGFTSMAQVEEFVGWYEGQGSEWFAIACQEGVIDVDFMGG